MSALDHFTTTEDPKIWEDFSRKVLNFKMNGRQPSFVFLRHQLYELGVWEWLNANRSINATVFSILNPMDCVTRDQQISSMHADMSFVLLVFDDDAAATAFKLRWM